MIDKALRTAIALMLVPLLPVIPSILFNSNIALHKARCKVSPRSQIHSELVEPLWVPPLKCTSKRKFIQLSGLPTKLCRCDNG